MTEIDWRRWFIEYVRYVAESEGTDFLGRYTPGSEFPEFSPMSEAEVAALTEARDEARWAAPLHREG